MKRAFTQLTGAEYAKTLARKLAPTADGVRDLNTRFGLRPYIVRIVRVRWSGGQRGLGGGWEEKATPLLPTPRVLDLSGLTEMVQPVGREEMGTVIVDEISLSFTHDQLHGFEVDGTPPPQDTEVYWEVEWLEPSGRPGVRRRFSLQGVPEYQANKLCWRVTLERAHDDRQRGGGIR